MASATGSSGVEHGNASH